MTKKNTSWWLRTASWRMAGFCLCLVLLCGHAMAATGESNAVRLDFRGLGESGPRTVAATEYINYDAGWGGAASGSLTINGVAVSGLSGSGTYTWTPDTSQTNFWKLSYTAGTVDYSATFQDLSTSIRKISARQRYPWNGLVDLSFTVTGVPGTQYDVSFVATDVVGGTNLAIKTLLDANGSALSLTNSIVPGFYKWVWNAEADLGDGAEFEQVAVVGELNNGLPLYIVVDLSGGSSATSYPVSYLYAEPRGGFTNNIYRTTKMVLRRCDAGSYILGSDQLNETHRVTLTKPFYMGVFEVTQKQYSLVMESNPASGYGVGDVYPVYSVSYFDLRGSSDGNQWPSSAAVDSSSFIGKLRSRSNLDFDLPTEAQWEYACRAGTTTKYYWGNSMNEDYAWYSSNAGSNTHPVGTKKPNAWGIYDMIGNVLEWCLDRYGASITYGNDPVGPSSGSNRILRGASINQSADNCYSYSYYWGDPNACSFNIVGVRLKVML